MGYKKQAIDKILKTQNKDNYSNFKIKITGDNEETNWMDISEAELKKIRGILRG